MNTTTSNAERRRSRALLAVGVVELLRPLFARWASGKAQQVYDDVCRLFATRDRSRATNHELLDSIDSLSESHCDDSHYRDYHVMLALSVIEYATKARLRSSSDFGAELDEMEDVVEVAENELEIAASVEELRAQALALASIDDVERAEDGMRQKAKSLAGKVNASLDGVEREYAWPPERLRWIRPGRG